jgi:hypothetical protein
MHRMTKGKIRVTEFLLFDEILTGTMMTREVKFYFLFDKKRNKIFDNMKIFLDYYV